MPMNRESQLREFAAVDGRASDMVVIIHIQPERDLVLADRRPPQRLEDLQQHVRAAPRGEQDGNLAPLDLGLSRGGRPGVVHRRRKLGNLRLEVNPGSTRSGLACRRGSTPEVQICREESYAFRAARAPWPVRSEEHTSELQ